MNKDVQEKWLKMLESAKKTQYNMQNPDRPQERCCLGHLCELYRQETGEGVWGGADDASFYMDADYAKIVGIRDHRRIGSGDRLPDAVAKWAGLQPCQTFLANANDVNSDPNFPIDMIKGL